MATTSPAGHIRKRPFQPSIHSYFHVRNAAVSDSSRGEKPQSPLSPPLPAETQASLISVGMRVRKSVPEGYKTHKTLGTQGFPFPSTAPSTMSTPAPQGKYGGTSTKELMPFCGLHKTGGWAAQEVPSSSAPAALRSGREGLEGLPVLSISQSTLSSTQDDFMFSASASATAMSSRKRTYEEEIEDDLDAYFDDFGSVENHHDPVIQAGRPLAKMKASSRVQHADQRVRIFGVDDFEEAAFLVPPEKMEMDF